MSAPNKYNKQQKTSKAYQQPQKHQPVIQVIQMLKMRKSARETQQQLINLKRNVMVLHMQNNQLKNLLQMTIAAKGQVQRELELVKEQLAKSKLEIECLDQNKITRQVINRLSVIAEECSQQQLNKSLSTLTMLIAAISQDHATKSVQKHSKNLTKAIEQFQNRNGSIQIEQCIVQAKNWIVGVRKDMIVNVKQEIAQHNQRTEVKMGQIKSMTDQLQYHMSKQIQQIKEAFGQKQKVYQKEIKIVKEQLVKAIQTNQALKSQHTDQISALAKDIMLFQANYNKNIQLPLKHMAQQIQKQCDFIRKDFIERYHTTDLQLLNNTIKTYFQRQQNNPFNKQMTDKITIIQCYLGEIFTNNKRTVQSLIQLYQPQGKISQIVKWMQPKLKVDTQRLFSIQKQAQMAQLQAKCLKQEEYIKAIQNYSQKMQLHLERQNKKQNISQAIIKDWNQFSQKYHQSQAKAVQYVQQTRQMYRKTCAQITNLSLLLQSFNPKDDNLLSLLKKQQAQLNSIDVLKNQLRQMLDGQIITRRNLDHQVQLFSSLTVQSLQNLDNLRSLLPQQPSLSFRKTMEKLINSFQKQVQQYKNVTKDLTQLISRKQTPVKASPFWSLLRDLQATLSALPKNTASIILQQQPIKSSTKTVISKIDNLAHVLRTNRVDCLKSASLAAEQMKTVGKETSRLTGSLKEAKLVQMVETVVEMVKKAEETMDKLVALGKWVQGFGCTSAQFINSSNLFK